MFKKKTPCLTEVTGSPFPGERMFLSLLFYICLPAQLCAWALARLHWHRNAYTGLSASPGETFLFSLCPSSVCVSLSLPLKQFCLGIFFLSFCG